MHAWKFHNDRLPDSQAAMLVRVGESHSYGARAARSGSVVSTGDRRLVGYRIPTGWGTLTEPLIRVSEEQRAVALIAGSEGDFLVQ
jgi:hypothetical protein